MNISSSIRLRSAHTLLLIACIAVFAPIVRGQETANAPARTGWVRRIIFVAERVRQLEAELEKKQQARPTTQND